MKIKLVSDSSANSCQHITMPITYVPLRIVTQQQEYVDTAELDVHSMLRDLKEYEGTSSTACPSISDWTESFGDSDVVYGTAITSGLSGSYNTGAIAAKEYMEMHPNAKVFLLDSLSTGPEMELILEKYQALIEQGLGFDSVCTAVQEYLRHTHLIFSLGSVSNLVKNGRLSAIVGKAIGLLGLCIIGRASERGTLEPMHKCRGEKKTLAQLLRSMKDMGYQGGKVRVTHTNNLAAAERFSAMVLAEYPKADLSISENGGLCSYYAEEGSIMVGFEALKCS